MPQLFVGLPSRALLVLVWLALGCAEAASDPKPTPVDPTKRPPASDVAQRPCESPRPEVCAQVYDPVCAQRDNGVRCVTTPCDSTDPHPYPNACEACRDPKVVSFTPGPCPE